MKTEHLMIAAVVIIGVAFATNSLLENAPKTTSTQASLAPSSTTIPETSTAAVTSSSTTTSRTSTTAVTSSTSTSSTTLAPPVADSEATVEITSDKSVYYSNQLMTFTVVLNSSDDLSYAKVSLRGIMAGYYRIDEDNTVNLSRGTNTLSFQYRAPKCYGCSGILPGKYNVSAELFYYSKSLGKDTVRIDMKQA